MNDERGSEEKKNERKQKPNQPQQSLRDAVSFNSHFSKHKFPLREFRRDREPEQT